MARLFKQLTAHLYQILATLSRHSSRYKAAALT